MKRLAICVATRGFQLLLLAAVSGVIASYLVKVWSPGVARSAEAEAAGAEAASDIGARYCRAELERAKADLEFVLEQNQKSPGFHSPIVVEELRLKVEAVQEILKELETDGQVSLYKVNALGAEGELKLAELRLQQALVLREEMPHELSESEVKRKQLAVKAARLALERVQDPAFIRSDMQQLYWNIMQLQNKILAIRVQQAERGSRTGLE